VSQLKKLWPPLTEDLKNVGGKHERTVTGSMVLRKMHDSPGIMEELSKVDDPKELAHVRDTLGVRERDAVILFFNNKD
jgi:hypothetical protein